MAVAATGALRRLGAGLADTPVRIIIPLAPGGGGDVFTRLIAEELQKPFGQPFVVENRAGRRAQHRHAGLRGIAAGRLHALRLSGEPLVYNQFLYKNLPFDPEKDFEPIATCSSTPSRWW